MSFLEYFFAWWAGRSFRVCVGIGGSVRRYVETDRSFFISEFLRVEFRRCVDLW
jgi:hypothetical protein